MTIPDPKRSTGCQIPVKLMRHFGTSVLVLLIWAVALVSASSAQATPQSKISASDRPTAMNIADSFTVTAVGDLIMPRPQSLRKEAGFNTVLQILKSSDITFGNFEGTSLDLKSFKGFPQAESGGSWLLATPDVPQDLKRMGFALVSRANNHATDWGVEGMLETDRLLDQAGIAHAGTGEQRSMARAARYLETAKGRIALVATAASFTPMSRAMSPLGEAPGRPGLSALRTKRYVLITAEQLQALRSIREAQPKGSLPPPIEKENPNDIELFGVRYRLSNHPGDHPGFSYEMDLIDLKEILKNIRQGKENSDSLIATIHAHEPGNWSDEPADFLPILAHAAIDNGADMFIGHGPHRLRGIEIYKGKPIFYSLGNFFFQLNLQQPIVADMWEQFKMDPATMTDAEFGESRRKRMFKEDEYYQSLIAVTQFERGQLSEVRLFPVYLGSDHDSDRGVPHSATHEMARTILERMQRLSQPFGTMVEIKGDVGIIHFASQSPRSTTPP